MNHSFLPVLKTIQRCVVSLHQTLQNGGMPTASEVKTFIDLSLLTPGLLLISHEVRARSGHNAAPSRAGASKANHVDILLRD